MIHNRPDPSPTGAPTPPDFFVHFYNKFNSWFTSTLTPDLTPLFCIYATPSPTPNLATNNPPPPPPPPPVWYGVNSYSSQFVLKSIRTHFGQFVLSFRSIRTHLIKFSQLVLILVDSYSVWSIRTHTKNMILIIYIILLMIDR